MELKDKKTTITFHAGILTIGGTVIEVAYENSHIFFDFGTEFRPELVLKDESLLTLIKHQLVPELDNIYDPKLGYENSNISNDYNHTAVFISHCHLDHTRMINYLDTAIPMYALKETKILLEALNENNDFVLPFLYQSEKYTRDIIGLNNLDIVNVGDIEVKVFRVDHDAYGAMGIRITTPDMTVTYTGDLRLHGFNEQDTLDFCQANFQTDVLIMEGVSISFEDQPERSNEGRFNSEEELVDAICTTVNEFEGKPATFNVYPANLLRIKKIIEKSPRKVVLEANLAVILKEVFGMDVNYYQKITSNHNLNSSLEIDYDIIRSDRGDYFWQIVENFGDIEVGGVYIHSDAAPLGDFDPAYNPFVEQFASIGVVFKKMTCSGHAHKEDLNKIISLIQPKLLIPIHTLKPEFLENPYGNRYLPKRSEKI